MPWIIVFIVIRVFLQQTINQLTMSFQFIKDSDASEYLMWNGWHVSPIDGCLEELILDPVRLGAHELPCL